MKNMLSTPPICAVFDEAAVEPALRRAAELLLQGGVVVCATDTGYLLGVNGLNREAIQKVYRIKGRDFDKPLHLVVADIEMANRLAEVDDRAEQIMRRFLPGPLTLILKKKPIVPESLVSGLDSVGLRIPENEALLRLVRMAGLPITATSANRSGFGTPYSVEQVLTELGEAAQLVDLIIDQGETRHGSPSTILDLTRTPPAILREGPITQEMLRHL
jgi:L-threonylcarbamoyladenylate synthase